MSEEQKELYRKLWAIADELRGSMDASEFKNYILAFIFYKYLSEKFEADLITLNVSLDAYRNDSKTKDATVKYLKNKDKSYILSEYLFSTFNEDKKQGKNIIDNIRLAFKALEDSDKFAYEGLFSDVDFASNRLGASPAERERLVGKIIEKLSEISFYDQEGNHDILGDAYEYMIASFASSAGKKAGEFYTPAQVSTLLSRLVAFEKKEAKSVYDPTCGSGSLLIKAKKELKVNKVYGQEKNMTTANLARMNMIMHEIKTEDFQIKHGDTLSNDQFFTQDDSESSKNYQEFDAIVANPPFSLQWEPTDALKQDSRFYEYGVLPPKSNADFAFIMHMLRHLRENGHMAVIMPHGVLFRGASEQKIRQHIIAQNKYGYLDAVIGLPSNLFYGTGIPTCILIFKKCRKHDDIFFIDASKLFEKQGKQNVMRDEHLDKVFDTYVQRKSVDKFAASVSLEEIKNNDYNLNIPRYVDTSDEEETFDLVTIANSLKTLDTKINELMKKHKEDLKELGLTLFD